MNKPLGVTATFLDEVTFDIAASNWGRAEWEKEFQTFVAAGIDTVVLIRGGLGPRLSHPSAAISSYVATLPVYVDMVEQFMTLADKHELKFFFGLYDSNDFWLRMNWKAEVAINSAYVREVWENYGHHPCFSGWYLPHETHDTGRRVVDINRALAEVCKSVKNMPVLSSPYWYGRPDMSNGMTGTLNRVHSVDEMITQWDEVMTSYEGLVDILAFQDGTVIEYELEASLAAMRELAVAHGIELWSNLETFDRDAPIKFLPLEWRKLVHKLTVAEKYVDKIITFEFSNFLSPNSEWPSARNLYSRYQEYLMGQYPPLSAASPANESDRRPSIH